MDTIQSMDQSLTEQNKTETAGTSIINNGNDYKYPYQN